MIALYAVSGSPFVWKVQLALEAKGLAYEYKPLSISEGDTKKESFLALNPRGKAPVLVDNGFVISESNAIIEYLEEKYTAHPQWPKDVQKRASARRQALEIADYLNPHIRTLMMQTLMNKGEPDKAVIAEAKASLKAEIVKLTFDETLTLVDFTLYPFIALAKRIEMRQPQHGVGECFSPALKTWMQKIEGLPYFEKTIPPHWKS
jgi:glutathione S-transferase